MKTSLTVAIAFLVTGIGLALLRQDASPEQDQSATTPPLISMSSVRRERIAPTTIPSIAAESSSESMPNTWSMPPRGSQRAAVPKPRRVTPELSATTNPDALNELTPMAREALVLVGTDLDANDFWAAAINDPDLSPDDRSSLIEDLNETGFDDPQHVTSNDLPLIESRLALIETLAPDAMDDVNAAAFEEAYKDLSKMRDELQPQAATERGVQFNVR